ncbi:MAG: C4-dicarboxylate ABC transporter substrate-binding protein [Methyloprofundus sp.]|nr:C4-dicarboxylate ABC transporter substrate-binding protein [Methyloprofundus sp.]
MQKKTSERSYKDLIITFGPAALLLIAGFWLASQFIAPSPPKKIVISTGSEQGSYFKVAQYYRQALAEEGIDLEILTSAGSGENIKRLLNKQVDIAFVQGGIGDNEASLMSLGSLYYEPLWLFVKKELIVETLADITALKISVGEEGSGTQSLAKQLLALNHIDIASTQLLLTPTATAIKALVEENIEGLFIVASERSDLVKELLANEQLKLINIRRADSYIKLLPFLSKVTVPEGIFSLENNSPPEALTLLAPTVNLVVDEDFNPALMILLLRAADKIHSKASVFAEESRFPSSELNSYPLDGVAKRFYKVGSPFLMRYLPFWPAVFIDRMMVMLVPLLMLMIPLSKIMPGLYRWRIRSRIYRWYKGLQEITDELAEETLTAEELGYLQEKISLIDREVNKENPPLSYADQLYNLLLHIDLVRKKLDTVQNKLSV